jgi:hypothetical protein
MLAQALETFHRNVSTNTRVPPEKHAQRVTHVLANIDDENRAWVESALRWSNGLTLSERLAGLIAEFPAALFHHLFRHSTDPATLVQRIVRTRNYFTHFHPDLEKRRFRGFELIEATGNLRVFLQYFLLLRIGVPKKKALDIAWATATRDYSRPRVSRGMLPTGD